MTDTFVTERPEEDKLLPAVVYGLYLLGFTNGLTFIVGLIVAYVSRDSAGPVNESHFTFAIRSFWLSIAGFLLGLAIFLIGLPLSLVLIGIPMLIFGGLVMGGISLWFIARCIAGIYYLSRGEAYPRPLSWLI
ncbi:hypothetical protein [uncultured Caulobacter sp.]|uniref:DUF4870 family protein n=1 Tax=uncultured Caulobacter sp. TaxID=158749 RepID=UPI002626F1C1|nr:hypothetical protein [uncultured Caulobacter sp.]